MATHSRVNYNISTKKSKFLLNTIKSIFFCWPVLQLTSQTIKSVLIPNVKEMEEIFE